MFHALTNNPSVWGFQQPAGTRSGIRRSGNTCRRSVCKQIPVFPYTGKLRHAFVIQGLSTGIRLNTGTKKRRGGFQANMEILPRVGSRAQSCVCVWEKEKRSGFISHARPNQHLQSAAYGETRKTICSTSLFNTAHTPQPHPEHTHSQYYTREPAESCDNTKLRQHVIKIHCEKYIDHMKQSEFVKSERFGSTACGERR